MSTGGLKELGEEGEAHVGLLVRGAYATGRTVRLVAFFRSGRSFYWSTVRSAVARDYLLVLKCRS